LSGQTELPKMIDARNPLRRSSAFAQDRRNQNQKESHYRQDNEQFRQGERLRSATARYSTP
jgi:hypothetical protein